MSQLPYINKLSWVELKPLKQMNLVRKHRIGVYTWYLRVSWLCSVTLATRVRGSSALPPANDRLTPETTCTTRRSTSTRSATISNSRDPTTRPDRDITCHAQTHNIIIILLKYQPVNSSSDYKPFTSCCKIIIIIIIIITFFPVQFRFVTWRHCVGRPPGALDFPAFSISQFFLPSFLRRSKIIIIIIIMWENKKKRRTALFCW